MVLSLGGPHFHALLFAFVRWPATFFQDVMCSVTLILLQLQARTCRDRVGLVSHLASIDFFLTVSFYALVACT